MPTTSKILRPKMVRASQQEHQSSFSGTKSERAQKVFNAIETISLGLLELDNCGDLCELGGKNLVDAAARMNKQYQVLEKLLDPMKSRIKVEALEANPGRNRPEITLTGNVYQAVVRKVVKTKIVAELVRQFMGPKIHKVQDKSQEITVSFGIKE
jgi:hypothetical protein